MRRMAIAVLATSLSVALGIMVVLGTAESQPPTPPEGGHTPASDDPSGQPYRIGALFALTGPAASLGQPQSDTAEMLQDQINAAGGVGGHPIEIIIRDTRSGEATALSAARELVEDENVLAIVGPSRSGTTLGIVDYMERSQVPLISCGEARAIANPVKKWVFQVVPNQTHAVQRLYEYLCANEMTQIAILTVSNGFGEAGRRQLESQAPDAGIRIVAAEQFQGYDMDMTVQFTHIRATGAQAIVCWGAGPGPARVARDMARLRIELPLLQSWAMANRRFIEGAGDTANGVVMPAIKLIIADQLPDSDPQKSSLLAFTSRFEECYYRKPDRFGGHAWDAIQITCAALKESGPDRAALRDEIEKTTDFVGMGGIFNYSADDHYGLTADAFALVRIEDGKWRLIE